MFAKGFGGSGEWVREERLEEGAANNSGKRRRRQTTQRRSVLPLGFPVFVLSRGPSLFHARHSHAFSHAAGPFSSSASFRSPLLAYTPRPDSERANKWKSGRETERVCVCVCVCVGEKEKERESKSESERERDREHPTNSHLHTIMRFHNIQIRHEPAVETGEGLQSRLHNAAVPLLLCRMFSCSGLPRFIRTGWYIFKRFFSLPPLRPPRLVCKRIPAGRVHVYIYCFHVPSSRPVGFLGVTR